VRGLLDVSRRRGPVLDPFAGAGTVGIVAAALGRHWIGVERDPRMAQLVVRRLRLKHVNARQREAPASSAMRLDARRVGAGVSGRMPLR